MTSAPDADVRTILDFFDHYFGLSIQLDDELIESGALDSVRMLELSVFLQETFHVEVSVASLGSHNAGTPRRIAEYVEQLRGAAR